MLACLNNNIVNAGDRRLLSGRNHAEKPLKLGTLDDLAKARRMVLDPSGFGTNVIPGDVLWSDPSPENGLSHNDSRGIGLLFGPDCTQEFMEKHKLKVTAPSHQINKKTNL
jgi:serine/threonine-protein phosphatase 5